MSTSARSVCPAVPVAGPPHPLVGLLAALVLGSVTIMTYVTAASLVMIPMSIMEAAILGPLFTAVRILVSLPLVILGSILIEKLLVRTHYQMPTVEQ